MKRTLPALKLSKSPLVLALCQVRFSAVLAMGKYIPKIQDRLRLNGYPVIKSHIVQDILFLPEVAPTEQRMHWEVQTKAGTTSIIIAQDSVVLQTTEYETFEPFLKQLQLAVSTVSEAVGGLFVQRVGLRYVDAFVPAPGSDWTSWVQRGLHGLAESDLIKTPVQFHQTLASTDAGTLLVRVHQNREGVLLPPDLQPLTPQSRFPAPEKGKLITILDLDHFFQGQFDFEAQQLDTISWDLHDVLDQVFRKHVATSEGLTAWN